MKTCDLYYFCDVKKCNCGQVKSWNLSDVEVGIYRKNLEVTDRLLFLINERRNDAIESGKKIPFVKKMKFKQNNKTGEKLNIVDKYGRSFCVVE